MVNNIDSKRSISSSERTFFCGVAAEPTADTVARGDMVAFGPGEPVIRFGDSWSQTVDTCELVVTSEKFKNTATHVRIECVLCAPS